MSIERSSSFIRVCREEFGDVGIRFECQKDVGEGGNGVVCGGVDFDGEASTFVKLTSEIVSIGNRSDYCLQGRHCKYQVGHFGLHCN